MLRKGEPMSDDTISRQAAIDALMKLQEEDEKLYGCSIPEGFDGDRAKEALEQLPSAQPDKTYEQGWKDGREALRKEIWEDGRDRLD